jgi:protein-tyrosine phosphatase
MASMAVADGIHTMICTPHQLGNFHENSGTTIREAVLALQKQLDLHGISLRVLPGGDVRIEDGMVAGLKRGSVMSLGDHRRHVLLELPHELYFPIEGVLDALQQHGMVGILSHPERNRGLLNRPELTTQLVHEGCLMQVTAGSLTGSFGPASQQMAEWMLHEGLVHFLATDAHGLKNRRPKMKRAFDRVGELVGPQVAELICCEFPARVACGEAVPEGRIAVARPRRSWFGRRASA